MSRILIAEDEDSVRDFVSRALQENGYEVTAVADGGAALGEALGGEFDLLLTDIRMPVMDGIALALNISAKCPDLPVLLMTGYASEKQRASNLESLVAEVLSKPFTLEQLLTVVRKYLPPADTSQT